MSKAAIHPIYPVLGILILIAVGCEPHNRSYVTDTGAARMAEAATLSDKWYEARKICIDEGLPKGTRRHARCAKAYRTHEVKTMQKRARALGNEVADRHGLCINPRTFDINRCQEI